MGREVTQEEIDLLEKAKADGFMNTVDIMKTLFPDRIPAPAWHGAYHWISGGGKTTLYLIPDGNTGVRKSQRTGIYDTDFPAVKQYKEDWYAQAALNDWTRNVQGGIDAGLSREESEKMMGERPPEPSQPITFEKNYEQAKPAPKEDLSLDEQFENYDGPLNRKGRPKFKAFREFTELWSVTRKQLRDAWDSWNG